MGKRANGEGTVFRRADGDWVAELTVPPRGTQKGYRKSFRGKTRTVVLERREAFKRELASNRPVRRKAMTLKTFGEQHFATTLTNDVTLGHLRDSTLVTYRHIWATHIGPVIGHVRLDDLAEPVLQEWLAGRAHAVSSKTGKPFSRRSQQAAYALLRSILNAAIKGGYIDRNPLSSVGVRAPRGRKRVVKHIEQSDMSRLLEHLDGTFLGRLVLLMFATGVRPGEALAARWRDIDLARGTWHVSGTLRRASGSGNESSKLIIGSTKTVGSDDIIPLPAVAVDVLTEHRRWQEAERDRNANWEDRDLVFTTGRGRPLAASNVLRALKREAERAGVPGVSLHRLRHSAATAMLEEGVSAVATSRMLRHSSVATTMTTYAHVTRRMEREAVAAMDVRVARLQGMRVMTTATVDPDALPSAVGGQRVVSLPGNPSTAQTTS